jgi:glycosyl transferase family 25
LIDEIQVLLINLDRRPDRLAGMSAQLSKMNVSYTRLDAVDGTACTKGELDILPKNGPIGNLSTSTRACTASHLKAMRTLLSGKSNHALIPEDDVEILPALKNMVADDGWLRSKADIVKLEKFSSRRPSKLLLCPALGFSPDGKGVFRSMYSRHSGSAGYVISRRGAEIILSFENKIDIPIDHFLFNETVSTLFRKLRPAMLVQPILWQSNDIGLGSSILGAQHDKSSSLAKKLRSFRRGFLEIKLVYWQIFLLFTKKVQMNNNSYATVRRFYYPKDFSPIFRAITTRHSPSGTRSRCF